MQERPLLEAKKETYILPLESSEEENITKASSDNENTTEICNENKITNTVTDIQENRPNLLAASPKFGNIIALTEVTKPEDRYIIYV